MKKTTLHGASPSKASNVSIAGELPSRPTLSEKAGREEKIVAQAASEIENKRLRILIKADWELEVS